MEEKAYNLSAAGKSLKKKTTRNEDIIIVSLHSFFVIQLCQKKREEIFAECPGCSEIHHVMAVLYVTPVTLTRQYKSDISVQACCHYSH